MRYLILMMAFFVGNVSAETPTHFYDVQDGQMYGYEAADKSRVVMMMYLGEKNGKHQIWEDQGIKELVLECAIPCELVTMYTIINNKAKERMHFKNKANSIFDRMISDIKNGHVKQYKTPKGQPLWFDMINVSARN